MRLTLVTACALLVAGCGRIGFDVLTSSGGGAAGSVATGAGGHGDGAAGAGGGAGAVGDGAVLVLIDGGSCLTDAAPCGGIRLQYQARDLNKPDDPWIRPLINLFNEGSSDVPLSELTVRYWYTIETVAPQTFACDSAFVGSAGCGNVTGAFASVSPPRAGADSVFEVGFLPAAGALVPGGQTQQITVRFSKSDFSAYDESNDYSYATWSTFTDAPRLTVYRSGVLIWGIEPP